MPYWKPSRCPVTAEWINLHEYITQHCNAENELTKVATVAISKDNQMRKAKAIFSELAMSRELATVTCILAETQRQAEEWENYSGKREGARCALITGCWHGEATSRLPRTKTLHVTGEGHMVSSGWL